MPAMMDISITAMAPSFIVIEPYSQLEFKKIKRLNQFVKVPHDRPCKHSSLSKVSASS
jgi:hypothetical protein